MNEKTELEIEFENALGYLAKQVSEIFPERTGYIRINSPDAEVNEDALNIKINGLGTVEIGPTENEHYDERPGDFLMRMDTLHGMYVLGRSLVWFNLNLDGNVTYVDLITTACETSYCGYDAGYAFYRGVIHTLDAMAESPHEDNERFVRNFVSHWNQILQAVREWIQSAS